MRDRLEIGHRKACPEYSMTKDGMKCILVKTTQSDGNDWKNFKNVNEHLNLLISKLTNVI